MAQRRGSDQAEVSKTIIMDDAEEDVLAYMAFPKEHRARLHSTDKIDKCFPARHSIFFRRGRPRGEARRIG